MAAVSTCWPEQPMLQHLGAAADLGDTSAAAADGWKSCCQPFRGVARQFCAFSITSFTLTLLHFQ